MGRKPDATREDFMLIFRYKKLMQIYARAFGGDGEYRLNHGGGAFADSDEIREIVNLVKALNGPGKSDLCSGCFKGKLLRLQRQRTSQLQTWWGTVLFFKWGRSSFCRMRTWTIPHLLRTESPQAWNTAGVVAVDTGSAAIGRARENIRGNRYPQLSGVCRVGEEQGRESV